MEKNNSVIGIIVAVFAVIVIGGGIFWAVNKDNDNKDNKETSSQSQQADQPKPQTAGTIVVVASNTPTLS